MGGKKKGKGKKGKKSKVPEEPDDSTERLIRFYKKKCIEYSVPQSKIMKGYFTEFEEDQADVTKVRAPKSRFTCGRKWDGKASEH